MSRQKKLTTNKIFNSPLIQFLTANKPRTFSFGPNFRLISVRSLLTKSKRLATSGNRTRASRVAGENSTTEPTLHVRLWKIPLFYSKNLTTCLYLGRKSKVIVHNLWDRNNALRFKNWGSFSEFYLSKMFQSNRES